MSATNTSPTYWRSASQLAETPEFREILDREFPEGVADGPGLGGEVSRRGFLTAVAASVAATGLTGCRKPKQRILTYNQRPEFMIPGVPDHYATTLSIGGFGVGLLVRSNEGRPTKIEGNPDHPASLGGTSSFLQGELLNLYDPGRSKQCTEGAALAEGHEEGKGKKASETRAEFVQLLADTAKSAAGKRGKGLHLLLPSSASPTLTRLLDEFRAAMPEAGVHRFDPLSEENGFAGAEAAFGRPLVTHVAFDACQVVASFDDDFLGNDGDVVRNTKTWAKSRKITDENGTVSRLYVAEGSYSVTGSNADHRFRVAPSQVTVALCALAAELGVGEGTALGSALDSYKGKAFPYKKQANWIPAVARDLNANRGMSAVVVGPRQPAAAHAVAHAINAHLGNVDKTVRFTKAPTGLGSSSQLAALVTALNAGSVDTVVAIGCNPIYDAPADLDMAAAWGKAKTKIHVGMHWDETAAVSDWHGNLTHGLEAWGDAAGRDGMLSIEQPLIAPLYDGFSAIEIVAHLAGSDVKDGYELVRTTHRDRMGSDGFEAQWERALHDGLINGSQSPGENTTLSASGVTTALGAWKALPAPTMSNLELEVRPSNTVLDGRYANNPWMQELPDPITKLTWDNAAFVSRKTAEQLDGISVDAETGLINGANVVKLTIDGRSVDAPIWIVPGQADGVITVTLGYGREIGHGEVARGTGYNAGALRGSTAMWVASGVQAARTGSTYQLVSSQDHGSMEGRPLFRTDTLANYKSNPTFAPDMSPMAQLAKTKNAHAHEEGEEEGHEHKHYEEKDFLESLWKERDYSRGDKTFTDPGYYQWGMAIDLNSCTGCNACVVACVSENNISMVGKDQVAVGREMHWTRMDRYFTTDAGENPMLDDEPGVAHQPVPCMQCENAPCESVCPVAATTHSPEGLNDMAYNRCIGTRYCNNNCPYKVRRFNWFNFNLDVPAERQMAFNPNVTVRARGVMEKCTYCVQRINVAKINANKENRAVADGEIVPACAQGCPADAITFGDINDVNSAVSKLKASNLNYGMLSEMNMKPRTTYLAKVTNPNPELVA